MVTATRQHTGSGDGKSQRQTNTPLPADDWAAALAACEAVLPPRALVKTEVPDDDTHQGEPVACTTERPLKQRRVEMSSKLVRLFSRHLIPFAAVRDEYFQKVCPGVTPIMLEEMTRSECRAELEAFALDVCHQKRGVTVSLDFFGNATNPIRALNVAVCCGDQLRLLLFGKLIDPSQGKTVVAQIVESVDDALRDLLVDRTGDQVDRPSLRGIPLSFTTASKHPEARSACTLLARRARGGGLHSWCCHHFINALALRVVELHFGDVMAILHTASAGDETLAKQLCADSDADSCGFGEDAVAAEYTSRRPWPVLEVLRYFVERAPLLTSRGVVSESDALIVQRAFEKLRTLETARWQTRACSTSITEAVETVGSALRWAERCYPSAVDPRELRLLYSKSLVCAIGIAALLRGVTISMSHQVEMTDSEREVRGSSWTNPDREEKQDHDGDEHKDASMVVGGEGRHIPPPFESVDLSSRLSQHSASCVDVYRTWLEHLPPHAQMRVAQCDASLSSQMPLHSFLMSSAVCTEFLRHSERDTTQVKEEEATQPSSHSIFLLTELLNATSSF